MQSYDFLISELLLRIRSPRKLTIPDNFLPFLVDSAAHRVPEILLDILFEPTPVPAQGMLRFDKGKFIAMQESAGRGQPCRLFLPPSFADNFCRNGSWLNCFSLDRMLLPWGRLILHASAVLYQGKAYVFCAPSGTGKSTHAALWQNHFGAKVLNGDKVVLYAAEQGVMASGSPIAGSSGIYCQDTAPVAAVYLLKQGPKNIITPVSRRTAALSLYALAVKSDDDPDFNSKLLDLAVSFEKQLKVFSLECLPEKSAVECILKNQKG